MTLKQHRSLTEMMKQKDNHNEHSTTKHDIKITIE